MTTLQITYMPLADLKPRPKNTRTHSKAQIRQIADSIKAFGFTNALLVDAEGNVIAGHGRLEAAKSLGMQHVPTVRIEHLSPLQLRAYVIADNKLALNAGWDPEVLKIELSELSLDPQIDITLTGFSTGELDQILLDCSVGEFVEEGFEMPVVVDTVSRPGDLWQIGEHRLLCGNALLEEAFVKLLGDEEVDAVFTDPPYNVRITGHVSGKGRVKHGEFAMASGEMSSEEFEKFLRTVFSNVAARCTDGAICFACIDWRHVRDLLDATTGIFAELKNIAVWVKDNGGMGSFYRSQHELVAVFKNGTAPHINNVELGKHGRNRTNVWRYSGATTIGRARDRALDLHPTVKPISLVSDAILDCTNRGGLVLDPFSGAGTTIAAAQKTGRRARGIEIDPNYVDATISRLSRSFGLKANLVGNGQSFDAVRAERSRLAAGAAR